MAAERSDSNSQRCRLGKGLPKRFWAKSSAIRKLVVPILVGQAFMTWILVFGT